MSEETDETFHEKELTVELEDLPHASDMELLTSEELIVDPKKPLVRIDGELKYYDGDTSLHQQRRSDN